MNALISALSAQVQAAAIPLAKIPLPSWVLIGGLALLFWPAVGLLWSLLRWARDLARPDNLAREITLRPSDDGYIMLGQWTAPWIGGAREGAMLESKKTALLVRCGKKTARGTVRYSQANDMGDDVLGIPQDIADKLGLKIEPDPIRRTVCVRVARRSPIENLWNNADQSIKLSFRTAVWIAAITTAISLAAPMLIDHL